MLYLLADDRISHARLKVHRGPHIAPLGPPLPPHRAPLICTPPAARVAFASLARVSARYALLQLPARGSRPTTGRRSERCDGVGPTQRHQGGCNRAAAASEGEAAT